MQRRGVTLVVASLVVAFLVYAPAVRPDDVKMERDPSGSLHISITGEKSDAPAEASDAASGAQAQLSVKLSLKRTEIEKRLNAAATDLARTEAEIVQAEKRKFEGSASGGSDASTAVAIVADAAYRFAEEKRQRLDELRATEKDQFRSISSLYDEWDDLKKTVDRVYGKPPGWWREITCAECLSRAEVAAALR